MAFILWLAGFLFKIHFLLQVLVLMKNMVGDPNELSNPSEKNYPTGLLQLNALRLADILSDDSNFRSYITIHFVSFCQCYVLAHSFVVHIIGPSITGYRCSFQGHLTFWEPLGVYFTRKSVALYFSSEVYSQLLKYVS